MAFRIHVDQRAGHHDVGGEAMLYSAGVEELTVESGAEAGASLERARVGEGVGLEMGGEEQQLAEETESLRVEVALGAGGEEGVPSGDVVGRGGVEKPDGEVRKVEGEVEADEGAAEDWVWVEAEGDGFGVYNPP